MCIVHKSSFFEKMLAHIYRHSFLQLQQEKEIEEISHRIVL